MENVFPEMLSTHWLLMKSLVNLARSVISHIDGDEHGDGALRVTTERDDRGERKLGLGTVDLLSVFL